MEKREFLKKILLFGGVIGTGLISIPEIIENEVIYNPKKMKKKELFSTNLSSLEKTIMTGNLLKENEAKEMVDFHSKILKKTEINKKTEEIREKIIEIILHNSRKFSKRKPSKERMKELGEEIDLLSYNIDSIKKDEIIDFIGFDRNAFVKINGNMLEFGNSNLREFYQLNNYSCITESAVKEEKNREGKPVLWSSFNTLKKLAPDASFILNASNISKIPVEEIIAWANIESEGREFAIGREGEINRFQLHPLYIRDIYKNALAQNNALSEYIRENTSEKNLLENTVRNSKLSIALAVNQMVRLKKETNTYYEYVLAYNRGLVGASILSKRTKKKLENPETITEKETKYSAFSYYLGYLNAVKNFRKIKESII